MTLFISILPIPNNNKKNYQIHEIDSFPFSLSRSKTEDPRPTDRSEETAADTQRLRLCVVAVFFTVL
jgi:hypothetical protein